MEHSVVERGLAERDAGCGCRGGPSLEILKEIQRLYEERMEQIDNTSGSTKLQQQVTVLRSWVGDLVGQNTLLARAVEELEAEATSRLLQERRKNNEVVSELRAECAALRRRLARKDSDLRGLVEVLRRLREFDYCTLDGIHFFEVTESDIFGSVEWRQKKLEQGDSRNPNNMIGVKVSELKLLNESLHKENIAKEREIRQLNKDAQCYEQTIMNLRKEMSTFNHHNSEVTKKDAEVMAGMCCTGNECGEWEPVKDFSELLRDETLKYQERVHKMEASLKSSGDSIRALRKVNVSLAEEMQSLRRVCAALDEQCRAANMRAHFKDDIIREMRRQLKQAKAKSFQSCTAQTSTRNSNAAYARVASTPDVSVIERSTSLPILVSDASVGNPQTSTKGCSTPDNKTIQINTMHFVGTPKQISKTSISNESTECSSPDTARTDVPSKSSFIKLQHRDPFRICRPKESPWIRVPKKARVSLPEDVPKKTASTKLPPSSCPPKEATRAVSSNDSLKSCFSEESPKPPAGPFKICLPRQSPKGTPRSCLSKYKCGSEPKKTTFKCTSDKSSEPYFDDQEKEMADKSERFEEQDCPSSRAPQAGEGSSGTLKIKLERSTDSMKDQEDATVCEKCQTSDSIVKDSGATSSLADSRAACDALHVQNKLMATLQILQNKEETINTQADSLAFAEQRIATLSERARELKKELDRRNKEYTMLRKSVECKAVQKSDVCVFTDRPMEDQRDIVNTLENNLSVIEDLYRECFYETAKQENLIEMLRSSYLEVRLMDKQKADQIGRLQTVIDTQQWSLDRCQDIAQEVDGLKLELSNFLNSSSSTNNDSGMWERSEESFAGAPGVADELHDVREQLLKLHDLLALDTCTCEDNMKWRKKAEALEIKVGELRQQLCELECGLSSKRDADMKSRAEVRAKEQELAHLREQLMRSQDYSRDQSCTIEEISMQLAEAKASLSEKMAEVTQLRQENEKQANRIKKLQEELSKAELIIEENCKMRSEVSYLSSQASAWRAQLDDSQRRVRALESELVRSRELAAHIDSSYREKVSKVTELQAHLHEAHARATELCGEARRAVCGVRVWARRMRDKHRELENVQKEKDSLIAILQRRLEERQSDSQHTSGSENIASCSCRASRDEHSFYPANRKGWGQCREQSANEMPSCSSTPAPLRLRKKINKSGVCQCDAQMQQPERREARCGACAPYERNHDVRHVRLTLERNPMPRNESPIEQVLLRVEQVTEALADGTRRWARSRDAW